MRAVNGLVFHGGIPPWIVEDDVAGGGEVQAEAAGAQGNQKHCGAFAGLEVGDKWAALFRLTGEHEVLPLACYEFGADELEHFDEL